MMKNLSQSSFRRKELCCRTHVGRHSSPSPRSVSSSTTTLLIRCPLATRLAAALALIWGLLDEDEAIDEARTDRRGVISSSSSSECVWPDELDDACLLPVELVLDEATDGRAAVVLVGRGRGA